MTTLGDRKLEAEIAEIEARTARADELMEGHRAIAKLRRTRGEQECEAGELELKSARRSDALLMTDFRFAHQINIVGHIGKDTVLQPIERLHQFHVIDPGCDITVILNSPGGSVIDGLYLFDAIRFTQSLGHKVTTIALGWAASMAGIILQVGDVRVMAKGSWLMIHEVAFSTAGKIGEIEDTFRFGERLKKQAADIFISRSGGKLTEEVLTANWTRKDWYLSPEEALGLGLIDEVR